VLREVGVAGGVPSPWEGASATNTRAIRLAEELAGLRENRLERALPVQCGMESRS
jgi:hypothetical protein